MAATEANERMSLRNFYLRGENILVLLFVLGICLFAFSISLNAKQDSKSLARQCFEYAYRIERDAPKRASQMYAWALSKNLYTKAEASLARTAYWRLYYLYMERQRYLKAFLFLGDAQRHNKRKYKDKQLQRVRQNLSLALQKDWKLSEKNIALLFGALRELRKNEDKAKESLHRLLQKNTDKTVLREEVLDLLVEENKIDLAKEILDELVLRKAWALKQEEYLLEYASLQIEEGAYKEARQSLEQIRSIRKRTIKRQKTGQRLELLQMAQGDRMRFYYLWGRTERGLKRYLQSARYFQQAASFGQSRSLKIQAAYSLYLARDLQGAFALLSNFPIEPHTDQEILYLILEIKLAKDKKQKIAKRKLKKIRPYLKAKNKNDPSPLAREALALSL